MYVNKAAGINDEANKLPLDAAARYEQLKKEANYYLDKAVPYLEKANLIQSDDLNTLVTLKQIYSRKGQTEKVKAIQEKINAAQKK